MPSPGSTPIKRDFDYARLSWDQIKITDSDTEKYGI